MSQAVLPTDFISVGAAFRHVQVLHYCPGLGLRYCRGLELMLPSTRINASPTVRVNLHVPAAGQTHTSSSRHVNASKWEMGKMTIVLVFASTLEFDRAVPQIPQFGRRNLPPITAVRRTLRVSACLSRLKEPSELPQHDCCAIF